MVRRVHPNKLIVIVPHTASFFSYDHRRTIFPLAIETFLYPKHLCLVSRDYFYPLQFYFSRSCNGNIKEGISTHPLRRFISSLTFNNRVKVPASQRSRWSVLCLASLTSLLALGTFFRLPEGVFATTTILTGITLAATGSYFQTSVIAIASLFGPTVIQSMLSGQAVVAVTLSAVQLISATTSLRASEVGLPDGVAETKSARLFFGISTTFLIMSGAANIWMTRLPSYRAVVPCEAPWIRRQRTLSGSDSPILGRRSASVHTQDSKAIWDHIISVTRRNIIYELAVAYVFMVTLVSRRARSLLECHNIRSSLSFPPSQYRSSPQIVQYTHSFSVRSISSSSMLATGPGDSFVGSRGSSSGLRDASSVSRSRERSLFHSSWHVTSSATLQHHQHHLLSVRT
jgi:hypothetical protein